MIGPQIFPVCHTFADSAFQVAVLFSEFDYNLNLLSSIADRNKLAEYGILVCIRGGIADCAAYTTSWWTKGFYRHGFSLDACRKLDKVWSNEIRTTWEFSRSHVWANLDWICAAIRFGCSDQILGSVVQQ